MEDEKKHALILGGGICGLYAAITLLRNDFKVTIIEKRDVCGGLAAGIKKGKNFYDYGVHMLHAHDAEIFQDIKKNMGEERIEVELDAQIHWDGKFYHYPLQFIDLVTGMRKSKLISCVFGLFYAQMRYKLFPKKPHHAREALIQLYGKALTDFFFQEFTENYWGVPTNKLSATFITTKMPRLTAVDVIKKALSYIGINEKERLTVDSALSEETLHYSRNGAEAMTRKLKEKVQKLGGAIILQAEPKEFFLKNNLLYKAIIEQNSKKNEIKFDYCINTIPLPYFFDCAKKIAPKSVVKSANTLRYKAIVIYGLLLKQEKAIEGLYVYYRRHIFHRICEPKNAGMTVKPEGHTILIVEMTCDENDKKWQGDKKVIKQLIKELIEEKIVENEEKIIEINRLNYAHGYPLYDLGFEEYMEKINKYIAGIKNLESVGRQGAFIFPAMHTSMRIGKNTAEKFVNEMRTNHK